MFKQTKGKMSFFWWLIKLPNQLNNFQAPPSRSNPDHSQQRKFWAQRRNATSSPRKVHTIKPGLAWGEPQVLMNPLVPTSHVCLFESLSGLEIYSRKISLTFTIRSCSSPNRQWWCVKTSSSFLLFSSANLTAAPTIDSCSNFSLRYSLPSTIKNHTSGAAYQQ